MRAFFKKILKRKKHFGYYLQIDLHNCNNVAISSHNIIETYIFTLCELIQMKRYGGTNLFRFGEGTLEGWSFAQLIETSSITGHFDEQENRAYIDIFSCNKFEYNLAINFTKNYFSGKINKVYKRKR